MVIPKAQNNELTPDYFHSDTIPNYIEKRRNHIGLTSLFLMDAYNNEIRWNTIACNTDAYNINR